MMGALMSACSLINAGAGTEEVRYAFCMLFNDIKKGGGKGETETMGKTGERGSKEIERK